MISLLLYKGIECTPRLVLMFYSSDFLCSPALLVMSCCGHLVRPAGIMYLYCKHGEKEIMTTSAANACGYMDILLCRRYNKLEVSFPNNPVFNLEQQFFGEKLCEVKK